MIILPSMKGVFKTGSWTPKSMAGIQLWTKADQGFTAGTASTKAQWNDLSGNGRNLIANANGSTALTYDASSGLGKPSIYFDGTSPNMSTFSVMPQLNVGSYLIAMVLKHVGNNGVWLGLYGQSTQGYMSRRSSTWPLYATNGATAGSFTGPVSDYGTMMIIYSVSSSLTTSENNAYGGPFSLTGATFTNISSDYGVLGRAGGNASLSMYSCYVGELIVCSSYTATDIVNLKTYLNKYWNTLGPFFT
jgi:hypothetical protein